MSSEQARKIAIEKAKRELGPVLGLLEDPEVIEIILNQDGVLWVERLGRDMEEAGTMVAWQATELMGTIAKMMGTIINSDHPILECELPMDGSRFEGMIPPVVPAPVFSMRKHATRVFSLQDYVDQKIMTMGQKQVLEEAIKQEQNILVAGGTGSGKTTLTNALILHISQTLPKTRLVILEDTRELQCRSKNYTALKVIPGIVDMLGLLMHSMRLRPDRIIVGEVRSGAALALLKAWNTGHPGGIATLHANSAEDTLLRLEGLVGEASSSPQKQLIARTINMVVHIARRDGKRRVREIAKVQGYEKGRFVMEKVGI